MGRERQEERRKEKGKELKVHKGTRHLDTATTTAMMVISPLLKF